MHFGHIKPTLEIISQLGLSEVRLLPCRVSPFKDATVASPRHRLEMLQLVAANVPELIIDQRELLRDTPSYTYNSVVEMREECEDCAICWLLGEDAFYSLPGWYRATELVRLCHLIVSVRTGNTVSDRNAVLQTLNINQCEDSSQLAAKSGGLVLFANTTPVAVSSTEIRQRIKAGQSPKYLLPGSVWNYIKRNRLYGYTE